MNAVLPITLLSLLSCCVFILPASSGEKASFSVTVFLSLAVFLTIISQDLPEASNSVAIFNVYVFAQVLTATLVTVVTLIQIRLYHVPDKRPVSKLIQKLGCYKPKTNVKLLHGNTINSCDEPSCGDVAGAVPGVTWNEIADQLDVVLFAMFISLNVIVLFICVVWGNI